MPMDDVGVIDQFTNIYGRYIDTGFGLLRGEISFLTATLVAIDITLAGLFWALGGENDVIAKLIKKTLYVGAFAFIINNWNALASILFRSFAGLGLTASQSALTVGDLLRPGRLAAAGVDAARPILNQMGKLLGFPDIFHNFDTVLVLGIAWLIVIVSFFIVAVQLFVTIIEFKLTTLAGFVLVPFALWGKTAFLAERVLGQVVSSGIKVLVLAVIAGIGSGIFGQFQTPPDVVLSTDNALALMLAALALLGLGLFGPAIGSGLVSGAPQLGAGAAAGTALAAGGLGLAAGATARLGGLVALGTAQGTAGLARSGYAAYKEGVAASGGKGAASVGAGLANVARSAGSGIAERARGAWSRMAGGAGEEAGSPEATADAADAEPAWARRMRAHSQFSHGVSTAAHTARSGDAGGAGANPSLPDEE